MAPADLLEHDADYPPEALYEAIRAETHQGPRRGRAGLVACGTFVIAAAGLLIAFMQGVDSQQLVIGAAAAAAINLVVALTMAALTHRE
jgi:hypothetical protein